MIAHLRADRSRGVLRAAQLSCRKTPDIGEAAQFSHVIVERADRFGRNDTGALRAMDELHESFRATHWIEINPERAIVWHGEACGLVGISDRERV